MRSPTANATQCVKIRNMVAPRRLTEWSLPVVTALAGLRRAHASVLYAPSPTVGFGKLVQSREVLGANAPMAIILIHAVSGIEDAKFAA
jgi:hypothetical protein